MNRFGRRQTKIVLTARLYEAQEGLPAQRLGKPLHGKKVDELTESDSPWYESANEVQKGLWRADENRKLMAQIQEIMQTELSLLEAEIIELRYFRSLTFREIGDMLGRDPSTILRISRAAIVKLRHHLGVRL